jgi:hypothetical protein
MLPEVIPPPGIGPGVCVWLGHAWPLHPRARSQRAGEDQSPLKRDHGYGELQGEDRPSGTQEAANTSVHPLNSGAYHGLLLRRAEKILDEKRLDRVVSR